MRHLLDIDDLTAKEINQILDLSEIRTYERALENQSVALFFEKPSIRTRNSMEVAIGQLGAQPLVIRAEDIGMGTRESIEDVAQILSGFHQFIGARVMEHSTITRLAQAANIPVVNLLSDLAHPCQTLADLLTIRQHFGSFDGVKLAYIGDGNNVCNSLMLSAALMGIKMQVATPPGYEPATLSKAQALGGDINLTHDPLEAISEANVVYTDVWPSVGKNNFANFTIDAKLFSHAADNAIFMHCLPVHRGEEVTADVCDGPASLIWQLAENRLHTARGLFLWLAQQSSMVTNNKLKVKEGAMV